MPSAYSLPEIYKQEIESLVKAGYYSNRSEVVRDAIRVLFETRSELKLASSVELYKNGEVTLGRAAEIAGMNIYEFKDILKDRGIKIRSPGGTKEELEEESKVIEEHS
uniref:Protein belonging to Uncharacterized protein family UPF0175 n=1 Tax=uncultured organism TaxID=155900 RepID=M1P1S6_9ZZZZ|nr:protein belonging to Uncharacterized protein family UPF0175 [uncultured organism]